MTRCERRVNWSTPVNRLKGIFTGVARWIDARCVAVLPVREGNSSNEEYPFDCRMMLRGVTVVPAMVWLAVCVAMVGATNLHPSRLTPDQYAPLISHRHGFYRSIEDQPNWKDQGPAENQSFDPSIGPRRSMSADTGTSDARSSCQWFRLAEFTIW